uniref:Putative secreted protein n=1 Tax=Anopheles darlingi TaxID=43151 RepID=A0A2M4D5A2_ANODA
MAAVPAVKRCALFYGTAAVVCCQTNLATICVPNSQITAKTQNCLADFQRERERARKGKGFEEWQYITGRWNQSFSFLILEMTRRIRSSCCRVRSADGEQQSDTK